MFLAVLGNRSTSLFVNYIRIIRHDKQKKFIIIFKIYPKTKYRSQYRRDRQIKAAASFGSGLCQPPRYASKHGADLTCDIRTDCMHQEMV